ncbi:unnamed protein product [Camellia sinensis]
MVKKYLAASIRKIELRWLAFEAFYHGSWKSVACIRIRAGSITMLVVDGGDVFEENVSVPNLRVRSRKANWSDCIFLRPGLDVCVLSTSQLTESSSEEKNMESVWFDAQVNSIERKPHEPKCTCQFYVRFYVTQDPLGMSKKKLSKDTITVQIDQMSILQNLQKNPCENEHYRWDFSEDNFSSLQKYKLLTGKFSSDLSWLLVASVVKKVEFDVRSIQNRIVYQILGDDLSAVNFKLENERSVPIVVPFTLSDILEKGIDCEIDEEEPLPFYDLMGLRRSKRRCVQPDRYLGCGDLSESDIEMARTGICKTNGAKYDESDERVSRKKDSFENRLACQIKIKSSKEVKWVVSKQREHQQQLADQRKHQSEHASVRVCVPVLVETDQMVHDKEDPHDAQIPDTYSEDVGEKVEGRWEWKGSHKKFQRKMDYSTCLDRGIFHNDGTNRKRSFSPSMCKEMIRTCMENIKSTIKKEQPLVIDLWKEIQAENFLNLGDISNMPLLDEEEDSEIDMWEEMEFSMASTYLLDDSKGSNVEVPVEVEQNTSGHCGQVCQHEYELNEEIGILCQLCGFVSTEIKDVSPTFFQTRSLIPINHSLNEEDSEHKADEGMGLDLFGVAAASNMPLLEREDNVWALIPDLKRKLHFHQKRAFEFLWRNVAGSLVPELMEQMVEKRGGCVISHSPGAGKTLLIIAFLVSYLKLFPRSRPLVLAPKTTLCTWYKEVNKWEIPIPVYQIHGLGTYRDEHLRQKLRSSPEAPKASQDVMHLLDCMEKIEKWLIHPSVLLMGYTSFLTLTREDSKFAHKKYLGKVLRQSPGILILDEGHNPRSTKSRLRKALMKVETGLRILLSGTLFQNNFKEYFNTLTLARPSFVSEVLRKLDPKKFKRRKRSTKTHFLLENRARKFFIHKIAKKIDSGVEEKRMEGLNMLKNLTSGFIDVYEGGSSDNLPGLQCYTIMMKSTPSQQELLTKLQGERPLYKGFPLEMELLITLASIHPWLIRTTASSSKYFSAEELNCLEKYKLDLKSGSKVRFIMSLVPRCIIRREKILIFCHNLAPINLFLDIFESFYGWQKGEEVLVLQGDIELFERGRIMDKFEEPGGPSKVMLASITACAEGISLTAASRVILLDSGWNPSKRKQAIARAFRPGQVKVVYVYQLLAAGSLEEEKYSRTTWKERVSSMIFSEELVEDPSQWQAEKIEDDILREIVEEDRATLFHMIMKNEKALNGVIRGKE